MVSLKLVYHVLFYGHSFSYFILFTVIISTTHLSKGCKAHAVQSTVVSVVDKKLSCPRVWAPSGKADCALYYVSIMIIKCDHDHCHCTSCIASNYWVVFDLVVKPLLILIGATWAQYSISTQIYCHPMKFSGKLNFKVGANLICQTGAQTQEPP